MAKLGDFIAFQAAINLLKENKQDHIIDNVYKNCLKSFDDDEQTENYVKDIYAPFTAVQISKKIAQLLTPDNINSKVNVIYQSISDLHASCPDHNGDWYFTGNYPTPGGNRVVNRSFINYIEGKNARAY